MSGAARRIPPHPRVRWSRWKLRWPFLVWLAAVAAAGWLYLESGRTATVSGVVEVVREEAAPLETARLARVAVTQGQPVSAGELLAEFDTSLLDAEIAQLRSELALEEIQIERQFSRAINEAEFRLRDLRLQAGAESNRLEAVRDQIKAILPLLGTAPGDARQLALLRAEESSLLRSVATYPETIRLGEGDLERAREQIRAARRWTGAGDAGTLEGPAKDLLAAIARRREQFTLRARQPGIVSRVLHLPGDVVRAADPVVSLVANASQHIIAFVPEAMAHEVPTGAVAWISRPFQEDRALAARITALGPEVLALPTRVSPVQGSTVRGRRVVLVIEAENDFMPGETVRIQFARPLWIQRLEHLRAWRRGGAPASAPAP